MQINRLARLNQRVKVKNRDPLSSTLNKDLEFLDYQHKKINKISLGNGVTSSVSLFKNETSDIDNPLNLFKNKFGGGSSLKAILGIAAVLGFLYKDKILNKLKELYDDFIEPLSLSLDKILPEKLRESAAEYYNDLKESVSSLADKTPIKSAIDFTQESFSFARDKLKSVQFTDLLAMIASGLGLPDNSVEKLLSISSKIKSAVSGIFGRHISNPFNFFADVVTGKFAISAANWLGNKIKNAFKNIISFGKIATNEVIHINAQYKDNTKNNRLITRGAAGGNFGSTNITSNSSSNGTQPAQPQVSSVSQQPSEATQSGASSGEQQPDNTPVKPLQVSASNSWVTQPITTSDINSATIQPFQWRGKQYWTSPQQWLRGFIAIESWGNPTADNGTYEGIFQLNRTYAIFNRGNRYNPHDNFRMAKAFWLSDCVPALNRKGVPISALSLYMTHQQGPAGGSTLMKNFLSGNNRMSGSAANRVKNGGVKGDVDFGNMYVRIMSDREATLRSRSGGGPEGVAVTKAPDNIETIHVNNIPTQLLAHRETQQRNRQRLPIPNLEKSDIQRNIATSIEGGTPAHLRAVRINQPSILKMALSTRML